MKYKKTKVVNYRQQKDNINILDTCTFIDCDQYRTNYDGHIDAKFFCLFLWLCINVLHDIGECCESVPLDRTGSYISISINITNILACIVQVDAFYYQSLSWLHLHCNGSWLLVFK